MPEAQQWYVEFFQSDYLNIYGSSFTTERTAQEAGFVIRALGLKPGQEVLDLACGQGRHAVYLARSGMQVTGLDLQADYLALAVDAAKVAGVRIETVAGDMRAIPFDDRFDAVINMFTAFGYLESDAEDEKVIQAAAKALKLGGLLMLDLLNREWVTGNYFQNEWRRMADDKLVLEHREFDLLQSRIRVGYVVIGADGERHESRGHDARLYTLTEISAMLDRAGLRLKSVYGGYSEEPYAITTRRMIVVAQKG